MIIIYYNLINIIYSIKTSSKQIKKVVKRKTILQTKKMPLFIIMNINNCIKYKKFICSN